YGDDELTSIIFHELSHQVIYIADDSPFNEAFAVTVEREGLSRWLTAHGRAADLTRYLKRRERQEAAMRIIKRHREQLATVYGSGAAPEVMRERKRKVFADLVTGLKALDAEYGVRSALATELEAAPNNARLASLECSPNSNTTCHGSMTQCARSRNCRARRDTRNSASATRRPDIRAGARVRGNRPRKTVSSRAYVGS